ncbi:MAG: sulfotransferase [Bacteroidia bacterium]|nr:sulfotransferase [Bacteroidia bacterium]
MKPNFIIGGTSAGGTSFLTAGIINHPEIYLPKEMRPEPHYFYKSWEYEKPFSYYEDKYFKDVKGQKAIGERSSSYMFGENVAERMYKHLPDIKLIFMLRNPIERAFANYRYTVLEGLEELSFEEVLEREPERIKAQQGIWAEIQPHNYTGRGFYYEQLNKFMQYYPKEKMLILKSDAFGKNPVEDFKRVFRFLGVDENYKVEVPPSFTSLSVKDNALQVKLRAYFQDRFDLFIETIRMKEDASIHIQNEQDKKHYELMKSNLLDRKEAMPESCRTYLQGVFKNDIEKLKSIVDFPVDDWK